MNIQQAAQSALDVQNGCNTSGIFRVLMDGAIPALWDTATKLCRGSDLVNRSPVIAMYLYKVGELNGRDISSLNDGYAEAEKACQLLASGMSYGAVVDLDTGMLLDTHK